MVSGIASQSNNNDPRRFRMGGLSSGYIVRGAVDRTRLAMRAAIERRGSTPQAEKPIPLTAIVLTQNEAINIERCLRCLARVDDVVIVDSGSSDETVPLAVATRPDVRILYHAFQDFGDQRNWSLANSNPRHDWILFVDADEFCTDALLDEITAWLRNPCECVGGFIAGKTYFLGRWLKHASMFPSYQVRLLKRGEVTFCKHGHGQQEVTNGSLHYFEESWVHEAFSKGVKDWIDRHNNYSSEDLELVFKLRQGKVVWGHLLSKDPLLRRRSFKGLAAKLPGRPLLRFLYSYFFQGGFLDGYPGFLYCALLMAHHINLTAKIAEKQHGDKKLEAELMRRSS
jgi:glycosyltransferase involved in cell wall biosynthesis